MKITNILLYIKTIPARIVFFLKFIYAKPQYFFLLVAGTAGITTVFVLPPFQAPDEHTHFYKAVQLSKLDFKAEKISDMQVGEYFESEYGETVSQFSYMWLDPTKKVNTQTFKNDALVPQTTSPETFVKFENTAVYPPLTYIPQAIGITITRIFKSSILVEMYAARIMILMSWLTLVFLAIKTIPTVKWGLVALAVTPLTIMLSASSSNDALVLGFSILWVAYVLKLRATPVISRIQLVLILCFSILFGLIKPPYLIIMLLIWIVPSANFQTIRHPILVKVACSMLLPVVIAAGWMLFMRDIYIPTNPLADTPSQIHFVVTHPFSAFKNIVSSLTISPVGEDVILQSFGLYSWLAIKLPLPLTILNFIVVTLLLFSRKEGDTQGGINAFARIFAGLVYFLICFAAALLIYLSFNKPMNNQVDGLNSRHLLPAYYLLLISLGGILELKRNSYNRLIVGCSLFLVIFAVAAPISILMRFYIL